MLSYDLQTSNVYYLKRIVGEGQGCFHEDFQYYGKEAEISQERKILMGFDQYHEPASDLSQETRTFARMIASLQEECEAIGWYQQRISIEQDAEAKSIMEDAQKEEFLHFAMDLEFLIRRTPKWRVALQKVLFQSGNIIENKEKGEDAEEKM